MVDCSDVRWGSVEWTNLRTLYLRAYESRSPAPILGDTAAAEAVDRIEYNNVIAALADVTGKPWTASAADYMRYLDLAADCAYELHTDPDVIERRLFQIGE